MSILIQTAIAGGVVSFVLLSVRVFLHKHSASERHCVSVIAFASVLAFPVFAAVLPQWEVLPITVSVAKQLEAPSAEDPIGNSVAGNGARIASTVGPTIGKRQSPTPDAAEPQQLDASVNMSSPEIVRPEIRSTEQVSWWHVLTIVWSGVAGLLLLRLGVSFLCLRRLARETREVSSGRMYDVLNSVRKRMALAVPVRLRMSGRHSMPMTWGFRIRHVLLPSTALDWDRSRLESVLLHELEHIRRGDCWTNMIVQVTCALHWFNPLIWLCANDTFSEAEQACDDGVLRAGVRSAAYAGHLLQTAAEEPECVRPLTSLAMARTTAIERRIHTILDERTPRMPMTRLRFAIVIGGTLGLILSSVMLRGALPEKQTPRVPAKPEPRRAAKPTYTAEQIAKAKKHSAYNAIYRADTVVIGVVYCRLEAVLHSFPERYGYRTTVVPIQQLRHSGKKPLFWRDTRNKRKIPAYSGKKCVVAVSGDKQSLVIPADGKIERVARIAVQQRKIDKAKGLELARRSPRKHPLYKRLKGKTGVAILRDRSVDDATVEFDGKTELETRNTRIELGLKGPLKPGSTLQLVFRTRDSVLPGHAYAAIYEVQRSASAVRTVVKEVIPADEETIAILSHLYSVKLESLRKIIKRVEKPVAAPTIPANGATSGETRSSNG